MIKLPLRIVQSKSIMAWALALACSRVTSTHFTEEAEDPLALLVGAMLLSPA